TTLTDGSIVVVYEGDEAKGVFNTVDLDPALRFLGAAGAEGPYPVSGDQTFPVVAPRPGGALGIVFTNPQHADGSADANGTNITYVARSSSGSYGAPVAIGDLNGGAGHDALLNPDMATLSTGRQVVVFERAFSSSD